MSDRLRSSAADLPIGQCHLDLEGLRRQRERYRTIGRHAIASNRHDLTLEIDFGPDLDRALLDETLEVERRCCPFFRLDYDPDRRRLAVSVDSAHERALGAIEYALFEAEATPA